MNSETLYRYSKARQHYPGFSALQGNRPDILYEQINPYPLVDTFRFYSSIHCLGRYRCGATARLCRNPIGAFDLLYLSAGKLEILCENAESVTLLPGEVFLSDGTKPYELRNRGDGSSDLLLLSHYGIVSEKYYELICRGGKHRHTLRSPDMFTALLQNLTFYMKYPSQVNHVLAVNTLSQILAEIYLSSLNPAEYTTLGQPKWFLDALQYMDKNYPKKITVAHIASGCGLSGSHFHKLFREYTGVSPYEYLLKLRIDRAKTLLSNEGMPVKCVALTVGFPSVNHFIGYFRKETGLTPETYRRERRNPI